MNEGGWGGEGEQVHRAFFVGGISAGQVVRWEGKFGCWDILPAGLDCCKRLVGAFQEVLLEVVKLGRCERGRSRKEDKRKGSALEGGALPKSGVIGRRNGRRPQPGFGRYFA